MAKRYAYDLNSEEWEKYLWGEPKYRAGQLFDALQKGTPFDAVFNILHSCKEIYKSQARIKRHGVNGEISSG